MRYGQINTVLSTLNYTGENRQRLIDIFSPAGLIFASPDSEEFRQALLSAEVALLARNIKRTHLTAPRLRWIHVDHAGIEQSAFPELFDRKIVLTSSSGRSAPALAEHALFFMLALNYNIFGIVKAQRLRHWGVPGMEELRSLHGKTLAIIGLGNTARELAIRAKAFGMNVLAYRRKVSEQPDYIDRLYASTRGDTLDDVLSQADFLVIAASLNDNSHHLIGEREIGLMKPSACIINIARGALIDEQALIRALHAGTVGGAGLDVVESEPLDRSSPLWRAPRVLITPHRTPRLPDRTERSLAIIEENARRFRAGEELLNRVEPDDVYSCAGSHLSRRNQSFRSRIINLLIRRLALKSGG